MAFRISKYRDTEFNDNNGSGVFDIDTTVYCDTASDLPGADDIEHYHLVLGCRAIDTSNGDKYYLTSDGNWEFSTSGKITIDSELSDSSENPVQNKVVKNAIDSKVDTSVLQAMTQDEYDALITKSAPLYFIYEEE